MVDMPVAFVPELQLSWSLESLGVTVPTEVVIKVSASEPLRSPDPMGRQVRDVLSWPVTFVEHAATEFRFSGVLIVRLSDEYAGVTREDDVYEGHTFRRYSQSELLREGRDARPADETPVLHYQLVFQDEQVDVVCTKPPQILLRGVVV
jgi:hypothetical protein